MGGLLASTSSVGLTEALGAAVWRRIEGPNSDEMLLNGDGDATSALALKGLTSAFEVTAIAFIWWPTIGSAEAIWRALEWEAVSPKALLSAPGMDLCCPTRDGAFRKHALTHAARPRS